MQLLYINNMMTVALLTFILAPCFAQEFMLDKCMKKCPKSYFPVCGSDGKTYGNMCVFQIEQCRDPNLKLKYLEDCKTVINNIKLKLKLPDALKSRVSVKVSANQPMMTNSQNTSTTSTHEETNQDTIGNKITDQEVYTQLEDPNGLALDEDVALVNGGNSGFTLDKCMKLCPKNFHPLCGSDGSTYGNKCDLERQCRNPRLKLKYVGPCKPNNFSPVSLDESSDGSTGALRDMAIAELAAIFGGGNSDYKVEKCMKMCSKIFLPLCGSDGRTYGNKCVFEIEQCRNTKLSIRYPGQCKYEEPAVFSFDEIFSFDESANDGPITGDPCNQECPSDFKPICGTDGITYPNMCMLMIGVCKDTELRVKQLAPCSDDVDVFEMLGEWRGTTRISSNSKSDSEVPLSPNEPDESDTQVAFDEFVKPPEDDSCMVDCPEDGLPICGTDGVTYLNNCMFMIALCRNPQLRVKYLLPCSPEDEGGQKNWDSKLRNEGTVITYDEPGKPKANEYVRASKWSEGSSEEKEVSGNRTKDEEKEETPKTDIWLDESLPWNNLDLDLQFKSSSEEGYSEFLLNNFGYMAADGLLLDEGSPVGNKVNDAIVTVEDLNNYIEDKVGYLLDVSNSAETLEENLIGADGLQNNRLPESHRRVKSLNIEDYSGELSPVVTDEANNEFLTNGFDKYLESLLEVNPMRSHEGITEDAAEDSPSSPLDTHLFGRISMAKKLKDKLYEKFLNMLLGSIRVVPYKPETLNEFTWDSLTIYLIERIIKDMSPKGWQEIVGEAGDVETEEGFIAYIKSLVEFINSKISEKAKSKYPNAEEMSLQELLGEMETVDADAVIKYLKNRIFQEFRAVWGIELPFVGPIENIWEKLERNEFRVEEFIPFDEPMAGSVDQFHMPKESISSLIGKEIMDFCTPRSSVCQNYAAVLKTTKDVLEQITPSEKALVEDYINTKLPQELKGLGIEEDIADTLFSSRPANLDFLKLGIDLILMQNPNEICRPNGILCNIVRLGMEVEKKASVEMTPQQIMAIEGWVLARMNELEKETSALGKMVKKYSKIYEERHPNMGGMFSLDETGPKITQQQKQAMANVTAYLYKAFMSTISGDLNRKLKKGEPWTDIVLEIIKDMIHVTGPKVWGPPMESISDVNQLKLKIGEFVKSKAPTKHISTLPDLLYKVHWRSPERAIIQNSLPYGLYEKFLQVAKTNPQLVNRVNLPAGLPKYSPKPGSMEKFMKLFMNKPYKKLSYDESSHIISGEQKQAMDIVTKKLYNTFMTIMSGDPRIKPKKGEPWADIVFEIIKHMVHVIGPKVWGPPLPISEMDILKYKISDFIKRMAPETMAYTLPNLLYFKNWQSPQRRIIEDSLAKGLFEIFLIIATSRPELVERVELPTGLPVYSPYPGSMMTFMKQFVFDNREGRLLAESETKKDTDATGDEIEVEWKSSSEEGFDEFLLKQLEASPSFDELYIGMEIEWKSSSEEGYDKFLQKREEDLGLLDEEGRPDLRLEWKSSSEEENSGYLLKQRRKLKDKGSLLLDEEATDSNLDFFNLMIENAIRNKKKSAFNPNSLFDEGAKAAAAKVKLAEALRVKSPALSPASVSAPVPIPAPALVPPSKPANVPAKAPTPANTASMDLPALAAALKAAKTTSSKAKTALSFGTVMSSAGNSSTDDQWYCKFVPRTDCGKTKVKMDCTQLCEGWTHKFSPDMNKMLSPDDSGLPSQISFPNGTVLPIRCTVSGTVDGRFSGPTFQKPPKCQENHICKEAGGKCIPKTDECEGDIICFGCKGRDCLCCVTSDIPYYKESEPCKETDVCTLAGGTCGPAIDGCKGRIINNGCHQRKCSCCAQHHESPTPNEPRKEDIVTVDEKMSNFDGSWLNDWPTSDKSTPSFCKAKSRCTKLGGHCMSITRECEGEVICHGCTSENCMCCIGGGFDPQLAMVTAENSAYTCKENSNCQKLGGKCIPWNERCYGEIICHGCYNRDCTCCVEDKEWKANITSMQRISAAVLESAKASAVTPAAAMTETSESDASIANLDDSWGCQYMHLSDCTDETVKTECPNLCDKGKSFRQPRMLDVENKNLLSVSSDKLEANREIIRFCFNEGENGSTNKYVTNGEDFNLDLFRKLALAANPSSSVFVSPYSFVSAFVLTYFGSAGKTEQKMRKVLNVQGKEDAYNSYYNFIQTRSTSLSAGAVFRSSNNGYIDSKIPLRECISSALPNIKKLDISNPTSAAREINEQILESTNWEINDLVTPGDIHASSLLLVNAAYFKGIWKPRFKQELTTRSVFHDEDNKSTGEVDMMNDPRREVLYVDSRELEAELVGIPCGTSSITLLLMLPQDNSNVRTVLKNLTPENLNKALKNSVKETLDLSIPKFKMETKMDHNLRKVIKSVFSPLFTKKTDLSGFTDTPIHIHKLLHKAVVDIAEEGDGDSNLRQSRSSKTKIKFNRPFVYLIRDNFGTTLFAGVFRSANDVEKIEE